MFGYAASRVAQTIIVLTAISFVGFLLVANLGDPLASLTHAGFDGGGSGGSGPCTSS